MSTWVFVLFVFLRFPFQKAPACAEQALFLEPVSQTWQFVGQVVDTAQYDLPGIRVDLAQLRFPADDGGDNTVWVTAGLRFSGKADVGYISFGPWSDRAGWQRFSAGQPLIRVVVDPVHPNTDVQHFAQSDLVISASFISSGGQAPGWYPWGFVFGTLAPLSCPVPHEAIHSIHFVEE
jgi:hypothetical protein